MALFMALGMYKALVHGFSLIYLWFPSQTQHSIRHTEEAQYPTMVNSVDLHMPQFSSYETGHMHTDQLIFNNRNDRSLLECGQ